jgi:hypothetical protein
MHSRDCEFFLGHGLLKLENSLFGVAVNKCLVNVQVCVEAEEYIHLPVFLFHGDEVLTDAFKG